VDVYVRREEEDVVDEDYKNNKYGSHRSMSLLTAMEETSSPLVVEDAQLFPPELVLPEVRLFKPLNLGPTDSFNPPPT
jgi:hypothetical protein